MRRIVRIKPLLVGLAPAGKAAEGKPALRGRCGRKLAKIMHLSGEAELWLLFDAVNLVDDYAGPRPGGKGDLEPPTPLLRQRAWEIINSHRWRRTNRVILLGWAVARGFGLARADAPLRWQEWGYWKGRRVAILPHPSGVNRWWNDPDNRRAASRFLRETAGLDPDNPQGELDL